MRRRVGKKRVIQMGMEGGRKKWGQIQKGEDIRKMAASMLADYGLALATSNFQSKSNQCPSPPPFRVHVAKILILWRHTFHHCMCPKNYWMWLSQYSCHFQRFGCDCNIGFNNVKLSATLFLVFSNHFSHELLSNS